MRVLLVQMPFFTLNTASISLSLVKGALDREGFDCDIRYLNIELGKRIGATLYTWIAANAPRYLLFGDLLFAGSLHGERVTPAGLRALAAPLPGEPGVPDEFLEAFPAMAAAAEKLVEDSLVEVPWRSYDLVGFNAMFQIAPVLAMARRLKSLSAAPPIILGGSYCEGEMGEQLCSSFPFVDFVCTTEGEELIARLAHHLDSGDVALEEIPGLVFRRGGRVHAVPRIPPVHDVRPVPLTVSPDREIGELDGLPRPRYDDWLAQTRAAQLTPEEDLQLPLETSRGCWWGELEHCTFCGLNGAVMTFRRKSAVRALSEIRDLIAYGVKRIHAVDNILDHRYYRTLLPALSELGHGLQIFFEIKSNVTHEQVRALARSGITYVQPGIESLSTEILKLMKKGVTALQNVLLLKWASESGMGLVWNLLYGFPGEDPAEFDRMAELLPALAHLQPPSELSQVRVDRFSPLYVRRDAEGLRDVTPVPAYFVVFPFERDAVARMAYYHDHRFVSDQDPGSYIGPLRAAVSRWREEAGNAVFASLRRADFLHLFDTRQVARERHVVLRGVARDVFLACEEGATPDALARAFGAEQAARVADEMKERRWLADLDGRLVSLAVAMDGRVPEHVPGPLAERFIVDSHRALIRALTGAVVPPPSTLAEFRARVAG